MFGVKAEKVFLLYGWFKIQNIFLRDSNNVFFFISNVCRIHKGLALFFYFQRELNPKSNKRIGSP